MLSLWPIPGYNSPTNVATSVKVSPHSARDSAFDSAWDSCRDWKCYICSKCLNYFANPNFELKFMFYSFWININNSHPVNLLITKMRFCKVFSKPTFYFDTFLLIINLYVQKIPYHHEEDTYLLAQVNSGVAQHCDQRKAWKTKLWKVAPHSRGKHGRQTPHSNVSVDS